MQNKSISILLVSSVVLAAGALGAFAVRSNADTPQINTAQVMSALPPGTVLFFNRKVTNAWADSGWVACSQAGLVRVDSDASKAGTAYAGTPETISTRTGQAGTSGEDFGNNLVDSHQTKPPAATGEDHTHPVTFTIDPGQFSPQAQNYMCLVKSK